MNISIKGSGSFPYYFKNVEQANKFTDLLGFDKGFCRKHPSGLTLYIHRSKSKKELCPIGITPLLFTSDIEALKSSFSPAYECTKKTYCGQDSYLLKMPNEKNLRILPESFLKSLCKDLEDTPIDSLICNNFASLKSKDPQKSADWYQEFLGTKTIRLSDTSIASVLKNGENIFLLIFDLETNRKHIGPANYKLFGIKSKGLIDSWNFFREKSKINPNWHWPKIDGPWRYVDITGPDGYTWRIYSIVNVYDAKTSADFLQMQPHMLAQEVENKKIDVLPEKYCAGLKPEGPYYYEDQLLQLFWKKSPYTTKLHFPNMTSSPTHLAVELNLKQ